MELILTDLSWTSAHVRLASVSKLICALLSVSRMVNTDGTFLLGAVKTAEKSRILLREASRVDITQNTKEAIAPLLLRREEIKSRRNSSCLCLK